MSMCMYNGNTANDTKQTTTPSVTTYFAGLETKLPVIRPRLAMASDQEDSLRRRVSGTDLGEARHSSWSTRVRLFLLADYCGRICGGEAARSNWRNGQQTDARNVPLPVTLHSPQQPPWLTNMRPNQDPNKGLRWLGEMSRRPHQD